MLVTAEIACPLLWWNGKIKLCLHKSVLRVNFPMSLEKLKRYRLQTIRLVTLHLRMFWRRIIATSKVVQLFSSMYLWSVFTNSSFISYNYSLKHKFWLVFYKWKCESVWQHQFWVSCNSQAVHLVFVSRNIANLQTLVQLQIGQCVFPSTKKMWFRDHTWSEQGTKEKTKSLTECPVTYSVNDY